ncbi:hypothetical protein [Pedobacter alpinus]|uniref:Right handed beta helix region n=1 Tax=Pedobacter alpinus TaxID=1590643 RepID=A0ABW5TQ57_9SPHI
MSKNILFAFFLTFAFLACRKEDAVDYSANAQLQFSTDSLLFDTVFTSKGTTMRTLKVFNYNDKSVIISDIKLMGGAASAFKININGQATTELKNIKIRANDSIYVFVKAFIDPTNAATPFLVEDEIQINLNGNQEKIPLAAFGQNATYLIKAIISSNTTFTKGKPYIIYDFVTVNENVTLNVEAGARLYFHKEAKLLVSGTLSANGTLADSITFSSDRLERIYDDEPGQWEGIQLLKTSINNALNYCTVKNALAGIRVDSLSSNASPKLLLTNCIIKNHEVAGILGYNASVTGLNNLMYNCGQYLIAGFYGGDYNFFQNTLANYNFNFPRRTPSVYFTDNLNSNATKTKDLKTQFVNNIIFGSLTKELDFDKKGNGVFVQDFQNNLIKTDAQTLGSTNIYNTDPFFLNTRRENYELVSNSPAHDKGKDLSNNPYFTTFLNKDFLQKDRVFPSSLGCYEK